MSIFSSSSPKQIQKEYVEKRKRELFKNDQAKTDAVIAKLKALGQANGVAIDDDNWHEAYLKIHGALQRSSLTINVEAGNWFGKENTYGTYTSMYARSVTEKGKLALTDNDTKNPAAARAIVDDLVTVPEEWGQAHRFSQRKRLHNALNATGTSQELGKKFGINDPARAPKLEKVGDKYTTRNKHFIPEAKQVFAALNYGRRAHGSSTFYGHSYLVLKPTLKQDAIYFPGDTFYTLGRGTSQQATYFTIGALLERAGTILAREIWKSCYQGHVLEDTSDGDHLIEAHLFKEVRINQDVEMLVLSRSRRAESPKWAENEWRDIIANATKWCRVNGGIQLVFASP